MEGPNVQVVTAIAQGIWNSAPVILIEIKNGWAEIILESRESLWIPLTQVSLFVPSETISKEIN